MRLINTEKLELQEFFESQAPSYAILSHTWEEGEITFRKCAGLTESINSMYRRYQKAEECYAYLLDFAPGSLPKVGLGKCHWFIRGFTLQELIAPKTVIFFTRDWNIVGEKSRDDTLEIINRLTRIPENVLRHRRPLSDCTIVQRMIWASNRETTRPEDKACGMILRRLSPHCALV
ncbi:hypothetical protein QBC32DRAFT_399802 [Pseudoneurospora amorphoporcata]|uniref:Uncharacterized protein n=1 Tax=Pseudoneurospora amorphoporcata TaxID=241081 RepID=A0AAN6NQ50_9PEZI|nr:hypothetical protein QBC32DRAFT_399802 [Pseudoneurospora amorphoporcata]